MFGVADERTLAQMQRCLDAEPGARGALMADNHLGYSAPIGGVIAYRDHVSPAAVGYDIGCGNKAVLTDLRHGRTSETSVPALMDAIVAQVSFGLGRKDGRHADHPVIDEIKPRGLRAPARAGRPRGAPARDGGRRQPLRRPLPRRARPRVGGRALRVARLRPQDRERVPVARRGRPVRRARPGGGMDAPPVLIATESGLGAAYGAAMTLAGSLRARRPRRRLRAGARHPRGHGRRGGPQPPQLLVGSRSTTASGCTLLARKGATPARPGQRGFVGATMGEPAVILEGVASPRSADALFSTVHGAGRAMSRRQGGRPPGSGPPSAPRWPPRASSCAAATPTRRRRAYKRLSDVLAADSGTVRVLHTLHPDRRRDGRSRDRGPIQGLSGAPVASECRSRSGVTTSTLYPERLHAPGQVAPQPAARCAAAACLMMTES